MKDPTTATVVSFCIRGFRKKRGRKEELRRRKGAARGFRNLSVYKIPTLFERRINQMTTKFDEIMNKKPRQNPAIFGCQMRKSWYNGRNIFEKECFYACSSD
jgi:hypothetical protein